ncbi:hypothetical protein JCM8202_004201 [Rhodotorula sphaerocarpa]
MQNSSGRGRGSRGGQRGGGRGGRGGGNNFRRGNRGGGGNGNNGPNKRPRYEAGEGTGSPTSYFSESMLQDPWAYLS